MAAVDLYGNDAGTIRNAYKTSLQRDAKDHEVEGWLSGSYGGGGVNDWVNQIAGSPEAQQYKPAAQSPPNGTVVGQNPNVSTPMPVTSSWSASNFTPQTGFPQQNNQQGVFWDFNNTDTQRQVAEYYSKYLGRMPGFDDYRAHVGNPGGMPGIEDVIRNSDEAKAYASRRPATTGGTTGTTTGTTSTAEPPGGFQSWFMSLAGGKAPTPETLASLEPLLAQYGIRLGPKNARGFTDGIVLPNGQFVDVIESADVGSGKRWMWYIPPPGGVGHGGVGGGQLPGNQYSDPYTQLLEQLMKARIGMLQGGINDPMRQQLMGAYGQRAQQLGQAAEPEYQALLKRLESRFNDLRGPGYTGAEGEAIRTQALDPIESDRTAARQRVLERLAARGLDPNSGIAQQALLEVDKAFDGMRATTQTTLTTNDLQRREGRQQRADQIKGTLYDIPQARAREQLDVFSAMDLLEQTMRNEEQANSREAIGYGGALADLGPQRLQLAMQAAGMGGSPEGVFGNLYQMMNLNQNAALLNQRNSGQLWSGLGSLAYTLMNAGK